VAVPALPGAGTGLPDDGAGGLVPQHGTLAREQGRGCRAALLALRAKVESATWPNGSCGSTKYADELLDVGGLDWPEPIRNHADEWIGRSEGAEIVFTTAPDDHQPGRATTCASSRRDRHAVRATFMVLAPEHPGWSPRLTAPDRRAEVEAYVSPLARPRRSSASPPSATRPGVPIGASAINPVNGARSHLDRRLRAGRLWDRRDHAVPAHDERDFAFATKFGLPIVRSSAPLARRPRRTAVGGVRLQVGDRPEW